MLSSADMINIATKAYNSDRQLSIMQSLSIAPTAATAAQNSNVSKLYMVRARHSKEGPATEDRSSGCPGQGNQQILLLL